MNYSLINIDISLFLTVTLILFLIGALGLILNRNNILITIMSIEIMLLAVNLNFVIFSVYLDDIVGYIFVVFILTIAATESAIGLAILSAYYKLNNTIQLDSIKQLKG
jgi:NADH-quinone oxidoreductase subunit K